MLRAGLLVFAANVATLVLELVAGRLLSPYVGVSLYTWTSIIGVMLAGISVGNWIGGKVADRHPAPRTVGLLLLLGGLSSLGVLGLLALLGDGTLARPIPLLARIFLLTTIVFFPPSFLLGMITPVVIKLALPDVHQTGRVVGLIYAVGTLGSLVGNFLTGFVLVAYLPVWQIVVAVGVALLALGALGGEWWRGPATERRVHRPLPRVAGGAGASAAPAEQVAARPAASEWLSLRGNVRLASAVVVVSSFCTMAIELAASRILAPIVGVSLFSWTGIIGVVLAGIAVGNYLGGRIADRWPKQHVLGASLFLGGLTSLWILWAVEAYSHSSVFGELGLMERIVALTAVIFFPPVAVLGTISPQVIRLAITDLAHAGRVSGLVYAWSTAGAIVGTFATGWWLISLLGVYPLVVAAGLGLVLLAIVVGRFWRFAPALLGAVAITGGAVALLQSRGLLESPCTMETNYFCIKVLNETRDGDPAKALVLDHLVHSYVKPDDPSYLGYEHEHVQAEITRMVAARHPNPHVLLIGGGGYTYPRWVEAFVPSASIEVVEIDPGVTEIAYRELGLSRQTRVVSYNLDGRQFVHELAPRKYYHLVVQDAVNDLSVPYHILTKEYNDYIREILTDDGIYLLTVIDLFRDGQLLRAALRTMQQTFTEVELLAPYPSWESGGSSVFVVYGANRKLDLEELRRAVEASGSERVRTLAMDDERLRAYIAEGPQIVLTDQYAPVDNLISLLFKSRY